MHNREDRDIWKALQYKRSNQFWISANGYQARWTEFSRIQLEAVEPHPGTKYLCSLKHGNWTFPPNDFISSCHFYKHHISYLTFSNQMLEPKWYKQGIPEHVKQDA